MTTPLYPRTSEETLLARAEVGRVVYEVIPNAGTTFLFIQERGDFHGRQ
jgi:hypothetical protein